MTPGEMLPRTWNALYDAAMNFKLRRFEPEGAEFVGVDDRDRAWFKITGNRTFFIQGEGTGLFADEPEERSEPDWFYVQVSSVHAIKLPAEVVA